MSDTAIKERPICACCGKKADHLVKSTMGMVCRECKAPVDAAQIALAQTEGIRAPQSTDSIPNN